MGTDSLGLFNKKAADQILKMDLEGLTLFLEKNKDALRRKHSLIFLPVFTRSRISIKERIQKLLSEQDETRLKLDIIYDYCVAEVRIHLDYYGCYAHVLSSDCTGIISCIDYLPQQDEEWMMLLKPTQVDRIIASLEQNLDRLTIMGKKDIDKVKKLRDYCKRNPSYMVAYFLDL